MHTLTQLVTAVLCWRFTPVTDEEIRALIKNGKRVVIVTQAWSGSKSDPGRGNRLMARAALELARKHGLPIVAQAEVADAVGRDKCLFVVEKPAANASSKSTLKWNTHVVVSAQAEACRSYGFDTVISVVGPFHSWRTEQCWKKRGFEVRTAKQFPLTSYQDPNVEHLQSKYWFTLPIAIPWEILARLLFIKNNWI